MKLLDERVKYKEVGVTAFQWPRGPRKNRGGTSCLITPSSKYRLYTYIHIQ